MGTKIARISACLGYFMNHLILKGQKRGRILPFCSGTEKQKTTEILDFTGFSVVFLYMHIAKNAADRNRTVLSNQKY
jgi:hypothetical protein